MGKKGNKKKVLGMGGDGVKFGVTGVTNETLN